MSPTDEVNHSTAAPLAKERHSANVAEIAVNMDGRQPPPPSNPQELAAIFTEAAKLDPLPQSAKRELIPLCRQPIAKLVRRLRVERDPYDRRLIYAAIRSRMRVMEIFYNRHGDKT